MRMFIPSCLLPYRLPRRRRPGRSGMAGRRVLWAWLWLMFWSRPAS